MGELEFKSIKYCTYGEGEDVLFAFHGYGLDGYQFEKLEALTIHYKIVGFHLPYHQFGPSTDVDWLNDMIDFIQVYATENDVQRFSVLGYSIGSKIALMLIDYFKKEIQKVFLLAPYGLERHWGLDFISKGFGNWFFKTVVNTSLPMLVMKGVAKLRIINADEYTIIEQEIGSQEQRNNLCNTLNMIGKLKIDTMKIVKKLNQNQVTSYIYYGKYDSLFPYSGRNKKLLVKLDYLKVYQVNEGHWMMTEKLNKLLSQTVKK